MMARFEDLKNASDAEKEARKKKLKQTPTQELAFGAGSVSRSQARRRLTRRTIWN